MCICFKHIRNWVHLKTSAQQLAAETEQFEFAPAAGMVLADMQQLVLLPVELQSSGTEEGRMRLPVQQESILMDLILELAFLFKIMKLLQNEIASD